MVVGCVFCVRCELRAGEETKVAVEFGLRVASDVGLFSFCGYCGLLECVDIGFFSFYGYNLHGE